MSCSGERQPVYLRGLAKTLHSNKLLTKISHYHIIHLQTPGTGLDTHDTDPKNPVLFITNTTHKCFQTTYYCLQVMVQCEVWLKAKLFYPCKASFQLPTAVGKGGRAGTVKGWQMDLNRCCCLSSTVDLRVLEEKLASLLSPMFHSSRLKKY